MIEQEGLKTREELMRLGDDLLFTKQSDYPRLRRTLYDLLGGRAP